MKGWTFLPGLAALVTILVALGSLGPVLSTPTSHVVSPTVEHTSATVPPSPSSLVGHAPSSAGLSKAVAIEAALRAKGIDPNTIHLPNFAGAAARKDQPVAPSYTQAPAPMGVADLGLENKSGVLTPYYLNTTSVAGTANITNLQSLYVDGDGPDTYGIQLNSVATNVTVFGNSTYQFWSQNYVDYTPSSHQLVFGDEVWNFSNTSTIFPENSVYGFSPNGTTDDFPQLYQGYGPAITISYPFTLTLYLNTSVIADRPAFFFNYTVSNATFHQSSSYDYLIFNSTVGTPSGPALTPHYQADGYNRDPIGIVNDMEIDLLGNDDGDNAAFFSANATISLQYWNASASRMEEVPSAFNAGSETGETSVGLLVYSSGGTSPIALVRTGPAFLGGLWNYSTASGAVPETLDLQPANAFLFVNVGAVADVSQEQWVPTSASGTTVFYLPTDGTYHLEFLMSEYTPAARTEHATGAATLTITLVANTTEGVYTPLFALDNAELAAISSSGAGTAADPYVLVANQYGTLYPQFAQWNVYVFPVFPGLLIAHTSAWVDVTPPSFEINIPAFERTAAYSAGVGLPLTNDLQLQFYDASNISLVGAPSISGWLSVFLVGFPESSVMVWNCSNVLVASNTFPDQGDALLLYGGTDNTIWGNSFVPTALGTDTPSSIDDSGVNVTGVNETESGDLIYNNFFAVPIPATTPTTDPFYCGQYEECYPVKYTDTWNVSKQPATNQKVVNGRVLTGSIIGTSYQGGNYWSNYGTPPNPYGVLPYNDSGAITSGGDYVPLVLVEEYTVTFTEAGLPSGSQWSVTVGGVVAGSTSPSIEVESPNGTFGFTASGPTGYVAIPPELFTVMGSPVDVAVSFATAAVIQVEESGLALGTEWSVSVNGSGTGNLPVTQSNDTATIAFEVPSGGYQVTAVAAGYTATPKDFTFTVVPETALKFTFVLLPCFLTLSVSPASATVWVDGGLVALVDGLATLNISAGVGLIEATHPGYATYWSNFSAPSNRSTFVDVRMTAEPTPSITSLSPLATGLIIGLGILAILLLVGLLYFARRRPPSPATGTIGPSASPPAPRDWQEARPPPTPEWQETPPSPPST